MKLDAKHRAIIAELEINARQPFSRIAKKVSLSPQSVQKRVEEMQHQGIIKNFISVVNMTKLGYLSYRVYIRTRSVASEMEQKVLQSFIDHPRIFWVASMIGKWDVEIVIFAKNFYKFNQIWTLLLEEHQQHFRSYLISMVTYVYHFKPEETKLPAIYLGGIPTKIMLDKTDWQILHHLASNARLSYVELSEILGVVPNAVKYRIQQLEKKEILQQYRLWIDLSKTGKTMKKVLITTELLTSKIEKKMLNFCNTGMGSMYFIRCIGPWNIELELYVDDLGLRKAINRFRNEFSATVRDVEILTVENEYKMNYVPLSPV